MRGLIGRAVLGLDAGRARRHRPAPFQHLRRRRGRDIAGRVGELRGDDAGGAAVVEDLVGAALALLARLPDPDQRHIGELVGRRLAAGLVRLPAVGLEDRRGPGPAGVEDADRDAARRRLGGAARAADRRPHRRVRLLVGARPDIDRAVLEMRALPVERAVMAGHRLQDQVVRLPEAVGQIGRVGVGRRNLERHALDKAHVEPAARDHVDDRIFFGDADRVVAVADRHAEREEAHLFRLARQDRHRDRAHRVGAGRGRVMLVGHDVDAELVAQRPLVEIAVIEVGADFRVEQPAGDLTR